MKTLEETHHFDIEETEARGRAGVIRRFLASDDTTVPLAGSGVAQVT
jgi:hypothetical protein